MKALFCSLMILVLLLSLGVATARDRVGLPHETFSLPAIAGWARILMWDDSAQTWFYDETVWAPGSVELDVPEWDTWYFLQVWENVDGEWIRVKEEWVGHFRL
jgi:hypothetical protein